MFSQLGLGSAASASAARLGFTTPTPVQMEAIPLVLRGVDLLARAQTGTGKTAAFGLPLIDRLAKPGTKPSGRKPRALILVPTRELAVQVHDALSTYATSTSLRIAAIYGGVGMSGQTQRLQRGVDIVVATPGRLIDHLQRRTVDLSAIEVLTLDEADRMLDMGFLPALRRIVAGVPARRQTLLFSATLSESIVRLSAEFTRNAVRIDVSPKQVVATTVTHHVHEVAVERKRDLLTHLLLAHGTGQALVFCRTKHGANRVGDNLADRGVRTGVIHGNKSQGARSRTLEDFKAGRVRVLVATDIAARGLDIVELPLVVNFDLPLAAEDYVHRVGRTGRAGQAGRAVSLVAASEAGLLREIQRLVTTPLERVAVPTLPEAPGARPVGRPSAPHGRRADSTVHNHPPRRHRGQAPGPLGRAAGKPRSFKAGRSSAV
ncbi:MAG: DEAD/DEAH box helicase [Vicinamibacterales bacterium]